MGSRPTFSPWLLSCCQPRLPPPCPGGFFLSINLWSRHRLLSLLPVQSREDASPCRCPGQENAPACDYSAASSQHSLKCSSPPDPSPELPHEHPNPALLPHPHSLWLGPVLRTGTWNLSQREAGTACSTALPLPLQWPYWHQPLPPPSRLIPAAQPAPGTRLSLPWSPTDSRLWAWPLYASPSILPAGTRTKKVSFVPRHTARGEMGLWSYPKSLKVNIHD